jgi:hypothetical protein
MNLFIVGRNTSSKNPPSLSAICLSNASAVIVVVFFSSAACLSALSSWCVPLRETPR